MSCWYTVLSDQDTWNHLIFLTVVCFFTMFVVLITKSTKSVYDDNAVVNKALTLVSFVFAGYVSIVINRWDRIRNGTIGKSRFLVRSLHLFCPSTKIPPLIPFVHLSNSGQMWGALENLNMISMSILVKQASPTEEAELSARLMRYSRLAMIMTFRALQPGAETDTLENLLIKPTGLTASVDSVQSSSFRHSADTTNAEGAAAAGNSSAASKAPTPKIGPTATAANLYPQELLTEEERQWLLVATPGKRCAESF